MQYLLTEDEHRQFKDRATYNNRALRIVTILHAIRLKAKPRAAYLEYYLKLYIDFTEDLMSSDASIERALDKWEGETFEPPLDKQDVRRLHVHVEESAYRRLVANAAAKDTLFMLINILDHIPSGKVPALMKELRESLDVSAMDQVITEYSQLYIPRV